MTDPIAAIPLEEFVIGMPAMIFTDEEIAHWIRSNELKATEKVKLMQAILELKGSPPITGIIRTALREKDGLPPIPGDET